MVEFGEFQILGARGPLLKNGTPVALRPKALTILWYMVRNAGTIISKDMLMSVGWPDVVVSEGNLAVCVREIRTALGDTDPQPRFLETVHRSGYLFRHRPAADGTDLLRRGHHLAALDRALSKARQGAGQITIITGAPGMGKTALVSTWQRTLPQRSDTELVSAACHPVRGAAEPFGVFLDLFGQLGRGTRADELSALIRQYAPHCGHLLPSRADPDDPPGTPLPATSATDEQIERELVNLLVLYARTGPLAIVLEDMHWADPMSVDLLGRLARNLGAAKLSIIVTCRREDGGYLQHALDRLLAARLGRERELEPLTVDDVGTFVAARLARTDAPLLSEAIYDRSAGHPLFAASIVEYLAGLDQRSDLQRELRASVPDDIARFILLRLSERSKEERQGLLAASIFGGAFALPEIANLCQGDVRVTALEELFGRLAQDGHFIVNSGVFVWPDGTLTARFAFRHTLIADALRQTIPELRLARMHRTVARFLQRAYRDTPGEVVHRLATHCEMGHEFSRAVEFLIAAAELDCARHAFQTARSLLLHGIGLLDRIKDDDVRLRLELQLHLALGPVQTAIDGYGAASVETSFASAQMLCENPKLIEQRLPVLRGLAGFHAMRSDYARALEIGQKIMIHIPTAGSAAYRVEGNMVCGISHFFMGCLTDAQRELREVIEVFDPAAHGCHAQIHGLDPFAFSSAACAAVSWLMGRDDDAARQIETACAYLDGLDHSFSVAQCHAMLAFLFQMKGDVDSTRRHSAQAAKIAGQFGYAYLVASERARQGWLDMREGRPEQGIDAISDGITLYRATGARGGLTAIQSTLAEAHLMLGDVGAGLRVVNDALERATASGEFFFQPELWRLRARLVQSREGRASPGAADDLHHALNTSLRQGCRVWERRVRADLSALPDRQNKLRDLAP